jgi:hypothetical protein
MAGLPWARNPACSETIQRSRRLISGSDAALG